MGGASDKAHLEDLFRPRRDGEWEWEYERSKFVADWDLQRLAQTVALATIRKPIKGHAYSIDEITRIRNFLGANSTHWPNELLHRHTDEFAVLVGLRIRAERPLATSARIKEISNRLVQPAETLLRAIADDDFSKEFVAPWGALRHVDGGSLFDALRKLVDRTNEHLEIIRTSGAKGKPWDSDLKDFFIHMVALLCEFVDQRFEPTTKGRFGKLAYLLAGPLFEPDPEAGIIFLDGAIRKHVDIWNRKKKSMIDD